MPIGNGPRRTRTGPAPARRRPPPGEALFRRPCFQEARLAFVACRMSSGWDHGFFWPIGGAGTIHEKPQSPLYGEGGARAGVGVEPAAGGNARMSASRPSAPVPGKADLQRSKLYSRQIRFGVPAVLVALAHCGGKLLQRPVEAPAFHPDLVPHAAVKRGEVVPAPYGAYGQQLAASHSRSACLSVISIRFLIISSFSHPGRTPGGGRG